jgi:ABC-2 type transport system ATP-binding protein
MSAAGTAPVIEAAGLVKRYKRATAVDGIDLEVRPGEIFGLLGPNGAGKTTTILMLLGLTEPSAGTVRVAGYDPVRQPLAVKRRVGYMPDSVGFYEHLTARQNLRYSARLMGLDPAETDARIEDALAKVRLAPVGDRRVSTYSHGMRQRLGLAEVWLKRAEVAILDEPTSGLDPQSTHEFLDMIRELRAEHVAVLLSSHMLEQVQSVCDRVALFSSGRIVLQGTVRALAERVLGGHSVVIVEAIGSGIEALLGSIPGVRRVTSEEEGRYRLLAERDVMPDIASKLIAHGAKLVQLSQIEPSLDAIYTHYFQEMSRAA